MSAPANPVTEAYLAECATPDSRLRRALAELDVSETLRTAWPRLLPRPIMTGEAEFLAFGRDLVTIFELITSLPQRCFDGDYERFCAALAIDDRHGAWMRRLLGDGPPPMYGRADTYYDGSSFKLLEFNIGGALGGLETVSLLPKAYLRIRRLPGSPPSTAWATWTWAETWPWRCATQARPLVPASRWSQCWRRPVGWT